MPETGPQGRRGRRGNGIVAAGVVITALVVVVMLAVGVVVLVTRAESAPAATVPGPASTGAAPVTDTTEADRALCTAIAPLMIENDRFSNAYGRLGDRGTPARDAATPKFISDTLDWIRRIQPIVDQHPAVDPFLKRSLQRYIDDQHPIVVDLQPGPLTSSTRWRCGSPRRAEPISVKAMSGSPSTR